MSGTAARDVAMRKFAAAYDTWPRGIWRRGESQPLRTPEPSCPTVWVTAKMLTIRPSSRGVAPSSIANSGRSGSITRDADLRDERDRGQDDDRPVQPAHDRDGPAGVKAHPRRVRDEIRPWARPPPAGYGR